MLVLRRKPASFGMIDGSNLHPEQFSGLDIAQANDFAIETDQGEKRLADIFDIAMVSSPNEPSLLIKGNCHDVYGLAAKMSIGKLLVIGDVGDSAGRELRGGQLYVIGNCGNHLAAGMISGTVFVSGNVGSNLASPLPGKKSGMRGGDIFIAGNCGTRACERLRRGIVFVAGSVGDYAISQMIAGTFIALKGIGSHWGGAMRRGSLILAKPYSIHQPSNASLSVPKEFELSFLPLIWSHLRRFQIDAFEFFDTTLAMSCGLISREEIRLPEPVQIPKTRWATRQIGDLNCHGKSEVLVLQRISSADVT